MNLASLLGRLSAGQMLLVIQAIDLHFTQCLNSEHLHNTVCDCTTGQQNSPGRHSRESRSHTAQMHLNLSGCPKDI